jgi:Fe-Mn family superoxide dismutase
MINSKYNSFDNFKETFTKEALSRFGSGWVWLNFHKKNGLSIVSTPNQDNPLMTSIYKDFKHTKPLLCLDLWEHAYYLKYQNKRVDYVAAFWNIINWEEVAKNMDK